MERDHITRPATSRLHSQQTGHFSPSWLATLRFTSVDKHPVCRLHYASRSPLAFVEIGGPASVGGFVIGSKAQRSEP